jgi:hypothetical protein
MIAPYAQAFREEAKGDPEAAKQAYLHVVEMAAQAEGEAWQVPALDAAIDALVVRRVHALGDASDDTALVFRTRGLSHVVERLTAARAKARGPFARGVIAQAIAVIEEHEGDAAAAEKWRAAGGCVREALVVGPMDWTNVTGPREPGPFAAHDARVEASYASYGAFGDKAVPQTVRGRGCAIDVSAVSARPGLRDVVVDVVLDRAQTIGLALHARGAAVLRAGGRAVIDRAFELGGGETVHYARVSAGAGRLRIVVRTGSAGEADAVGIDAWDEKGEPLRASAPRVGDAANVRATASQVVHAPEPRTDDERLLAATAALAEGDGRGAERVLFGTTSRSDAPPELLIAYGRAVDTARDLSPVHRAERERSAYERALEAWPGAWEAILEHAVLAGVRRGRSEARIEMLRDLDAHRADGTSAASPRRGPHQALVPGAVPLLDAFEAATAGRDRLFDRAQAALARARAALEGTALFANVERAAFERVGAEEVASACAPARAGGHASLACFDALRAAADHPGAQHELDRVRALLGAPDRWLPLSLREALAVGDTAAANRAFRAMLPGERMLWALTSLDASGDARKRLLAVAAQTRDAPAALAPLLRSLGHDPMATFDGVAEKIAAANRAAPILPQAATAVLAHDERYDVDPSGLVHYVLFDVRRVSGTTDVEEHAQADAPDLLGRSATHALRRRILKKDGRILEPDRTPRAAQAHADLSQLEQGDVVEAIYEGWALPGETGDVGIDTPDLLPERTAVHDATIELRLPEATKGALWSHPMLGKATESRSDGARVLRWSLHDHSVRRVEEGIPKMDRSVGVSFGTAQWTSVARALRETIAAIDDHDPEISAWAHEVVAGLRREGGQGVGGASPVGGVRRDVSPPALPGIPIVSAIVEAAGKTVREAQGDVLSDIGINGASGGQASTTARTVLTEHEGSRSWLVVRALRELEIPADIVIAENEPFSADPSFPPHFGRFMHPLVVAHLKGADGGRGRASPVGWMRGDASPATLPGIDLWIDADVQGPPLPAGRISPELRGRSAIGVDGTIAKVPATGGGEERDEIDVRLALDAKGDAKGTFAVVLRGRDAQELAEILFRIVGAERQRALRGVVLAWLPFANVEEVALSSSEGSWQVSIRADVSVPGYAQLEGTASKTAGAGGDSAKTASAMWTLPGVDPLHWVYPRAHVATLGATYASQGARENALAINSAVQYHVHRRIELPKGATIARMPGAFDVKRAELEASRRIAVNGGALEDDFVLGIATGTIAAQQYGEFVRDAHKTDDAFLSTTLVAPPPQ